MKKKLYFILACIAMSTCLYAQTPILGEWITVDDATGEHKSVVRIYQADNGKYYGQIIALLGEDGSALCTE